MIIRVGISLDGLNRIYSMGERDIDTDWELFGLKRKWQSTLNQSKLDQSPTFHPKREETAHPFKSIDLVQLVSTHVDLHCTCSGHWTFETHKRTQSDSGQSHYRSQNTSTMRGANILLRALIAPTGVRGSQKWCVLLKTTSLGAGSTAHLTCWGHQHPQERLFRKRGRARAYKYKLKIL